MCEQQARPEFREAMRRVASTVFVVTTQSEGQAFGIAATAVTSLSMDPPSLLLCINQSASVLGPLLQAKRFCVNVLAEDDVDIAAAFSDSARRADRFNVGVWGRDAAGCPRLTSAVASMSCALEWRLDWATHALLAGRVDAVDLGAAAEPLLYHSARYCELMPRGSERGEDHVRTALARASATPAFGRSA